MICSSATRKDVSKYYTETYIQIPETGTNSWWWVRAVTDYGVIVRESLTSEEGLISFEDGSEYTIKNPLFGQNSWVNVNGKLHYICRRPARMWRKGVCAENTLMFGVNKSGELVPVSFSVKVLNAVGVEPVSELPKKLTKDIVLHRCWAIDKTAGAVFFKDAFIGRINSGLSKMYLPKEYRNVPLHPLLQTVAKEYV